MGLYIYGVHILLFIVILFPKSLVHARNEHTSRKRTKLAIDLGFATPYEWHEKAQSSYKKAIISSFIQIESNPNVSLGLVTGYEFELSDAFHLSPEIGINYGFTRRIVVQSIDFKEKYLQMPLLLKLAVYNEGALAEWIGLGIGYDIDFVLSSTYQQKPYINNDLQIAYTTDQLDEFIKSLPKVAGRIFIYTSLEFKKGFYLSFKGKLPIEKIKIQHSSNHLGPPRSGVNNNLFYILRGLAFSCIEINVGMNIMEWL